MRNKNNLLINSKYPMDIPTKPLPSILQKILQFEENRDITTFFPNEKEWMKNDKQPMYSSVHQQKEKEDSHSISLMSIAIPPEKATTLFLMAKHKDKPSNLTHDERESISTVTFSQPSSMSIQNLDDSYSTHISHSIQPWGHQSMPSLSPSKNNTIHLVKKHAQAHKDDIPHNKRGRKHPLLSKREGSWMKYRSASLTALTRLVNKHDSSTPYNKNEIQIQEEPWPVPTSIDEIHEFRKKLKKTTSNQNRFNLCRNMIETASSNFSSHPPQRGGGAFPSSSASSSLSMLFNSTHYPLYSSSSSSTTTTTTATTTNSHFFQGNRRKKSSNDDEQIPVLEEILTLEAQRILKRLARNGHYGSDSGDAQFLLANYYGTGRLGLPLDHERALSLYLYASKQSHHPESTYRAGVCYELGIGTNRDPHRAILFYRKAATQYAHPASMYKLSLFLLCGLYETQRHPRESIAWLQRAAAAAAATTATATTTTTTMTPLSQHAQASHALALLQLSNNTNDHYSLDDTLLIQDKAYAVELLQKSAHLGYSPSQAKLGELYEVGLEGFIQVDEALSIYWYTQAAKRGNSDASIALSFWYLTGSSLTLLSQSDEQAYLWARKAIECQHEDRWSLSKALFLVGIYIERDIIIPNKSTEDSYIWFERAAVLGHIGAMQFIELKAKQKEREREKREKRVRKEEAVSE
ncbi:uncharacterized protein BX663DRAFT_465744 [Cokeromyces recurvatus]|uniref:uncharacterized protein n=1 Tax=Cokeromyces recurvatus TaxID=90255 RepID=UPI00221FF87B|nr:uncharacterized protein BX663DRAFT_465744 [Cokeromyces recurvatus]KAI7907227.1 hypothetical protein BX663DRAFT_465744 [Cokeromyces recurvatus]